MNAHVSWMFVVGTAGEAVPVPLDRCAARNANFVLVASPRNGQPARSAGQRRWRTSRELCRDIKGRALG